MWTLHLPCNQVLWDIFSQLINRVALPASLFQKSAHLRGHYNRNLQKQGAESRKWIILLSVALWSFGTSWNWLNFSYTTVIWEQAASTSQSLCAHRNLSLPEVSVLSSKVMGSGITLGQTLQDPRSSWGPVAAQGIAQSTPGSWCDDPPEAQHLPATGQGGRVTSWCICDLKCSSIQAHLAPTLPIWS